ncbi:MAG: acetyl-CoA carboxylase carboxyl transferase subunit alpha, partial [Verrucomicrobiota bacterium]|nr:acetyl-CoA carboxylase carboxyl transferase subunit alpha [Verrucomicrobiota bacterium]
YFGCAHPEGYRKAMEKMRLAAKYGQPIIAFIDTPGAYPGVESEARHVSEAIAVNLREMAMLKVPSVAVIVGEGGSGGALGIGVTDRVLIFENAYYSVISPEGCAAILWKDRANAPKAAEALKLNAASLKELAVVDDVIPEPLGGAHYNPAEAAAALKTLLHKHLRDLVDLDSTKLLDQRYERYRALGEFREVAAAK